MVFCPSDCVAVAQELPAGVNVHLIGTLPAVLSSVTVWLRPPTMEPPSHVWPYFSSREGTDVTAGTVIVSLRAIAGNAVPPFGLTVAWYFAVVSPGCEHTLASGVSVTV